MKITKTTALAFAVLSGAAFADFNINITELPKQGIKDFSSRAQNEGIGYNAALEHVWGVGGDEWWFIKNKENTAAVLKQAGANLLRLQCMNSWFDMRNSTDPKLKTYPKEAFDFYKANGIKVFVCLEAPSDVWVDKCVEIVKWIVDNDYKSVVAGFELGNETYGNPRYPEFAPRWCKFIDRAEKIWPKLPLGINIAELFELNPDLKHMKARLMSNEDLKRDWSHAGAYFTVANFNRFSIQFVKAMASHLNKIDYIIYHAYGAETPYSCSYHGFKRFRNFVEMVPELKGKKYWLTEVRPRSDEDNHCQRQFREALIMGHYTLMALCQPETACFNHHQLTCLSGALFQSDGKSWYNQWYDGSQANLPDYTAPYNQPRIQVGAIGVAYRILGQGIRECPIFLAHGVSNPKGTEEDWLASSKLTDQVYTRRRAIKEGKAEIPSVTGDVEWVLASNKHRNKFCLLMVNSTSKAHKVNLSIAGLEFAAPTYRTITCPEEFLDCCEVPDEQRPWTAVAWEDTSRGYWFPDMEMYKGLKPKCDVLPITIKPHTIQTVTFMTRRARNAK